VSPAPSSAAGSRTSSGNGRPGVISAYHECFAGDQLDALLLPTTRLAARPVGQDEHVSINGRAVPTLEAYLRNTDPASVAGLPSISVPAGTTASGLPVGLSFDGPAGADATILALAKAFERLGSTSISPRTVDQCASWTMTPSAVPAERVHGSELSGASVNSF